MKTILSVLLVMAFVSCSKKDRFARDIEKWELDAKTDSTITINMKEHMVAQKNLSEIICDVSYLELEATDGSYLTIPVNIKLTDSLIYVLDLDEHLRCFNRNGKFLRNGYKKGRGQGEVISLYDFDVDKDYLYLLDGAKSAILRYTHDGHFVDLCQLPFRAIRFKQMHNGWYLFALAPFTMTDKEENYSIVLTDSSFVVKKKYFSSLGIEKSIPVARTPYFEPSRNVNGEQEAQEKGILYTYGNPIHANDYLIQNFYTSREVKGLFLYDIQKDESLFIKEVINDMDNVIRFNFDLTKFYDVHQNLFVGLTDVYFKGSHTEEEIKEGTSHLSDDAKSVLVRNEGEEGINPILMFYRLRKDIIK